MVSRRDFGGMAGAGLAAGRLLALAGELTGPADRCAPKRAADSAEAVEAAARLKAAAEARRGQQASRQAAKGPIA